MTDTYSDRVDELILEANKRGVDYSDIQLYDPRGTIGAFAELLNLSEPFALDLSLTLDQVKDATDIVGV